MRRQAYGAILSGALGGHAFGQKHVWRFDEQWRSALGSRQMAHVKELFATRAWHKRIPDQFDQLVTAGFATLSHGRGIANSETFRRPPPSSPTAFHWPALSIVALRLITSVLTPLISLESAISFRRVTVAIA
jgi:hypothetical protein